MGEIKFGTDGWRAVISEDFTFDNVKKVAQAMADYIKDDLIRLKVKQKKVIVGYDTRFLSEKYAEIIACVIGANGLKVILTDRPAPTPSISFAIKDRSLMGGVVVTASHNPAIYNGIKYKTHYAGSASPEVTQKIERRLGKSKIRFAHLNELKSKGMVRLEDIIPRHLDFIRSYVDVRLLKDAGLRVLADSMYGTGSRLLEHLLKGGRTKVSTIHYERNPGFGGINPEPILPNLKELAESVKAHKYDMGLATDGDADRLGVALPNGRLITGHKVMALLLLHLLEDRKLRGDVVQTICGTALIDKISERYNLKVHETPVGFKYISEIMKDGGVLVGGEETGGVAFKDYIPERDGILSGLLILEMMVMRRRGLEDILKGIDDRYGTYEYRRLDVRYPNEKKDLLMKSLKKDPPKRIVDKAVIDTKDIDGYKFICEDRSWLMLRLSGTEPILRIYAEASSEKKALKILEFGRHLANSVVTKNG